MISSIDMLSPLDFVDCKKTNQFNCVYCNKMFKFKKSTTFDNHTNLCRLGNITNNPLLFDDNEIPTKKTMYKMMIEMAKKITVLEENQKKMNSYVSKERQKLNIIDWLNTNVHPTLHFDDILQSVSVTNVDIAIKIKN